MFKPYGLRGQRSHCRFPHGECSQSFSMAQVLQQRPSSAGPMLHLSPTFARQDNREKLEQFIQQFICG